MPDEKLIGGYKVDPSKSPNTRIGALEKAQEKLQEEILARLKAIDECVSDIGKRVDDSQKSSGTPAISSDDLNGIKTGVDGLKTELAGYRASAQELRSDIDGLREELADYGVLAKEIIGGIACLGKDVMGEMRGIKESIGRTGKRVDDAYDLLGEVNATVDTLSTTIGGSDFGKRNAEPTDREREAPRRTASGSDRYTEVARRIDETIIETGSIDCYPPLRHTVDTIIEAAGLRPTDREHVLNYLVSKGAVVIEDDGVQEYKAFRLECPAE